MLAIFKRDLKSYFTSPLGYVFIAAFLAVMNVFFYLYNVYPAQSSLATVFNFMVYILIFVTPLLTMRLFSEEFKQKTDQLLLTSPVKISGIVIGKFLAALAIFAIALAVTLVYVVIIAAHGQPNVRELLANYLAIFCVASAFISIGVFISSLTENQLVSAVLTLAVFLVLYLVDTSGFGAENAILNNILYSISLFVRYTTISNGVLTLSDIVFYISVAAVFLFATTRVIEKKRWS